MLMSFLIFLTSGIDNFFHPLTFSLIIWILFLIRINRYTEFKDSFIIPYNLLLFPILLGFFYLLYFILTGEFTFYSDAQNNFNKAYDNFYFERFMKNQGRDDLQIKSLLSGRDNLNLIYSIIQIIFWFTLFFISIAQKIKSVNYLLNKLLLGSSLFFLFSWIIDVYFLVSQKPDFLDQDTFHGITSEPYRQSELALIHLILFFTKLFMNVSSNKNINKSDLEIILFGATISILNLLYLDNHTFIYMLVILVSLSILIINIKVSKLIFILASISLPAYVILLNFYIAPNIDDLTVLKLIDHTWQYQLQNHFYAINITNQCGIFGCGFGIWPPVPSSFEPIIFVKTYGGWGSEGTLYAKDLAGLWLRLVKDIGIFGVFLIIYIFAKLKNLMFSEIYYIRFFGLGFLVYSLSRLFHSGFYYNADLFLMLFFLFIFSKSQSKPLGL